MDVFAHVCGQKADTSSNYCDITRDISVFVKCYTIFRLYFFKLPQFHTSKFRKVVRQHTEGMGKSVILVLLEIYLAFQQRKKLKIKKLLLTKLSP